MTRTPEKGLAMKSCPTCGIEFRPYRKSQLACSRACHNRMPHRVAANRLIKLRPEVQERKNIARRVDNNPGRREINLRGNLRQYGVTPEQYRAMVAEQDNRCAICGEPPDPNGIKAASRLHVDHDHVTGKVRGLLCGRCNMGIGYFRENGELLTKAIVYLNAA